MAIHAPEFASEREREWDEYHHQLASGGVPKYIELKYNHTRDKVLRGAKDGFLNVLASGFGKGALVAAIAVVSVAAITTASIGAGIAAVFTGTGLLATGLGSLVGGALETRRANRELKAEMHQALEYAQARHDAATVQPEYDNTVTKRFGEAEMERRNMKMEAAHGI